eukprot:gene17613-biopygen3873
METMGTREINAVLQEVVECRDLHRRRESNKRDRVVVFEFGELERARMWPGKRVLRRWRLRVGRAAVLPPPPPRRCGRGRGCGGRRGVRRCRRSCGDHVAAAPAAPACTALCGSHRSRAGWGGGAVPGRRRRTPQDPRDPRERCFAGAGVACRTCSSTSLARSDSVLLRGAGTGPARHTSAGETALPGIPGILVGPAAPPRLRGSSRSPHVERHGRGNRRKVARAWRGHGAGI